MVLSKDLTMSCMLHNISNFWKIISFAHFTLLNSSLYWTNTLKYFAKGTMLLNFCLTTVFSILLMISKYDDVLIYFKDAYIFSQVLWQFLLYV